MKYVNTQMLTSATTASASGTAIDASQMYQASVQVTSTGASSAGTLVLQGSNDMPSTAGGQAPINNFIPTNWTSITGATVTVAGATSLLMPVTAICHQWLRCVFTDTAAGVQTITTVADVASSLAGTYFLISDKSDTHKYAVWFKVSGAGTAPVVAGYTAEEVDIATGDTASSIATATATVIAGLTGFASATPVSAVITVTNTTAGPFTPAVDGALPTGFTFANGFGTTTARLKSINV